MKKQIFPIINFYKSTSSNKNECNLVFQKYDGYATYVCDIYFLMKSHEQDFQYTQSKKNLKPHDFSKTMKAITYEEFLKLSSNISTQAGLIYKEANPHGKRIKCINKSQKIYTIK